MKPRLIFGLGAAAGLVGSIVAAALVLPLLVSPRLLLLGFALAAVGTLNLHMVVVQVGR